MKKWNKEALLRTSVLASFIAASAAAAPALAQEEDEEGAEQRDRIIVTGSRIARSDFTSESPVSVVTAADIQEAGNLDLGQILREQVAVDSGGFSASSNLSGGGASSISLRGLGAGRTLTMINGRRTASFADGLQNLSTDLGFVPTAIIERVEILRDGASAVYGADAVSGVVNIILRDDFEGFRVSGQYGQSDLGDYNQYSVEAVMGGNFNRGNIVISAGYASTEAVPQRSRDWAQFAVSGLFNFPSGNAPFLVTGSGAHPGGQFNFSGGGRWCTLPRHFGGDEITNVFGQVSPNGNGALCPSSALANSNRYPTAPAAGHRYDYAFQQTILNGSDRLNATMFGTYDITDDITAFVEFQYANRQSDNQLDGNPIFAGNGSPAFPAGWVVPANNPYNPFPGQSAQVQIRPTSTIGPRTQTVDGTNMRFVGGLQGTFLNNWDWEASFLHTRTTSSLTTDATFNLARAIRISNPTLCAADALCAAALKPGSLGALDVYRPGNWSQSEINYFRQIATSTFREEITGFSAFVGGTLFTLPAGDVGIAVGGETRRELLRFAPDAVTEAGESVANQTFSTRGAFSTNEIFGEMNVPILRDQPFIQELSLNVQGRYFDYSTFGSDSVYKLGFNWTMTDDIRVRGTLGTSFRIPTLVNSFSGGTVSFDFLNDPCDAAQINANPTRQANCLGGGPLGVNPGFLQAAPQLLVLAGGDLADGVLTLGPEQGRTWTIGTVITPSQVPGLRFSLDYYSIEVEDFIGTQALQAEVLNQCFDTAGLADPACNQFTRNPTTRQLQGLVRTPINRPGRLESAGFDWAAEYTFDVADLFRSDSDMGSLRLSHEGTLKTDFNLNPGIGNYNGAAQPEFLLLFSANWNYREFGVGWNTRFIPEMNDPRYDGRNFLGYDDVDSNTIHDLRLRWEARPNTQLLFGVNNVFNEEPPYAFDTGTNTITGLYGSSVIGRYFFGRITQEF